MSESEILDLACARLEHLRATATRNYGYASLIADGGRSGALAHEVLALAEAALLDIATERRILTATVRVTRDGEGV